MAERLTARVLPTEKQNQPFLQIAAKALLFEEARLRLSQGASMLCGRWSKPLRSHPVAFCHLGDFHPETPAVLVGRLSDPDNGLCGADRCWRVVSVKRH